MKTLNETLKEEFNEIKNSPQFQEMIKSKNLDEELLEKAFEILLLKKNDENHDKSKTEFENYIINQIKTDDN